MSHRTKCVMRKNKTDFLHKWQRTGGKLWREVDNSQLKLKNTLESLLNPYTYFVAR